MQAAYGIFAERAEVLVEKGDRGGRRGGASGTAGGGPLEATAEGAAAEAVNGLLRLACVSGTPELMQQFVMHPFTNTCARQCAGQSKIAH